MDQYDSFAGVTADVLEMISELELPNGKGGTLLLKEKDGSPKLKTCTSLLGFSSRHQPELVLREEKEIAHRIDSVLIRDQANPSLVFDAKIYNGKLREDYEPMEELYPALQKIHFDGNIMQLKTEAQDKPCQHIEDIGQEYTS